MHVFQTSNHYYIFMSTMKRKFKIPEKVWNLLGTAAIIACLALAAFALFRSFR